MATVWSQVKLDLADCKQLLKSHSQQLEASCVETLSNAFSTIEQQSTAVTKILANLSSSHFQTMVAKHQKLLCMIENVMPVVNAYQEGQFLCLAYNDAESCKLLHTLASQMIDVFVKATPLDHSYSLKTKCTPAKFQKNNGPDNPLGKSLQVQYSKIQAAIRRAVKHNTAPFEYFSYDFKFRHDLDFDLGVLIVTCRVNDCSSCFLKDHDPNSTNMQLLKFSLDINDLWQHHLQYQNQVSLHEFSAIARINVEATCWAQSNQTQGTECGPFGGVVWTYPFGYSSKTAGVRETNKTTGRAMLKTIESLVHTVTSTPPWLIDSLQDDKLKCVLSYKAPVERMLMQVYFPHVV